MTLEQVLADARGEAAPDVMTVEEVAALLRCSPKTIPTLNIPSHLAGRLRRYLRTEVLAWLAAQPAKADAA